MSGTLGHRERVIRALSHKEPDRIPFDLGSTVDGSMHIESYQKLKAYFNFVAEDKIVHKFMQVVQIDEPILEKFDVDLRFASIGGPETHIEKPYGEDGYIDEYHIIRCKPRSSKYYDIVKSPLAGEVLSIGV